MLEGDPEAASEVLNAGLKAFPANPRLLVRRSLVRLELAQGKKAQVAKLEKEIRADAEAAAKDPTRHRKPPLSWACSNRN